MFKLYFIICFVSFYAINLELFLTRILSLKTWNHVVYIVIPFAILGYGIGANIVFILKDYLSRLKPDKVIGYALIKMACYGYICTVGIGYLPICVDDVAQILVSFSSMSVLLWAYTLFAVPFTLIGFLIVYVFTFHATRSSRLYFFDLLGAGTGAFMFFFLINSFQVTHSLLLLCWVCLFLAFWTLIPRKRIILAVIFLVAIPFIFMTVPETDDYTIDKNKGWEWIPGAYKPHQYERLLSQWHPLGRTDIFRMVDPQAQELLSSTSIGTFEINVIPRPEFSYITTNYLAGAPIYRLSPEGLAEHRSKLRLFSQGMEVPYVLFDRPDVVIIGTGGGRDIFMAKSHGAGTILGAEINPAIVQALSPGGRMYEYSGGVYTLDQTKVFNVDGRHLVKNLPPDSFDLIVLNGVDTFSGLTSGAYAYAESYLYTKNALLDYLRVIKDDGVVNFNRWLFPEQPRETLRLYAIALDALKETGAARPWEHIIIGDHVTWWSIILIKKTPFTAAETAKVFDYFRKHRTVPVYPGDIWTKINKHPVNYFSQYARDFQNDRLAKWRKNYPYDISVVTDDAPFFYKYYKLNSFNPFKVSHHHHLGSIMFMTQIIVLLQALVFILLFILWPLWLFKRTNIRALPSASILPFISYFACLGWGFMFIEIPMMQKFVLLLGSPIYSISIILAMLLISAGIGSYALPVLEKIFKSHLKLIYTATALLVGYLVFLMTIGPSLTEQALGLAFLVRVGIVGVFLLPLGFLLGLYFPLGLHLIGRKVEEAIPWAWGINSGFSVFASMLAILIAQFLGFNAILILAAGIYILALFSYRCLVQGLQ